MTKPELHALPGFNREILLAAATYLRTQIRRRRGPGVDPTALINNEGRMNGYLDAIDELIDAATLQPPKPEKKEFQPYSAPVNENPNKL